MMDTDFEVIWNGDKTHDGDLLCVQGCPEKRLGCPTDDDLALQARQSRRGQQPRFDACYMAVSACLQQRSCTAPELRGATGYAEAEVRVALQRLGRNAKIRSVWIPVRERTIRNVFKRYYWRGGQ